VLDGRFNEDERALVGARRAAQSQTLTLRTRQP
jgi:hypothetical protein